MKRLAAWVMCLTLLLGVIPAQAAKAQTMLTVSFTGLTAQADGQWAEEALAGRFKVYQGGAQVGEIVTDGEKNGSITLPSSGTVTLVPVMDDMPAGYQVYASGYAISVTEGRNNLAALQVLAEAGLFTVQAKGAYDFSLTDENGVETLLFSTDENGWYELPVAIPSGVYTLRLLGGTGAPTVMELETYTGDEEQILQVVVEEEPAIPTEEPTAEPAADPTAEATAEVTATPAPVVIVTMAPTEEPTAEPSVEPTATPVAEPETGLLALKSNGEADYALSLNGQVVAEGTLTADAAQMLTLEPGDYTVTLTLPEGKVVSTLNGYPMTMDGQTATWLAQVAAGSEGMYQISLSSLNSISGTVVGGEQATVSIGDMQTTVADGAYQLQGVPSGEYDVTVALPAGDYTAEGWTLAAGEQGVTATLHIQVDEDIVLPEIRHAANAMVAGHVSRADGSAMGGVNVTLMDAAGDVLAQQVAAQDGSWSFDALEGGAYAVHVDAAGDEAVADAHVSLDWGEQATSVQLMAGEPGSIQVHVFIDNNNDGRVGKYEKDLAGVTVSAVLAGDASGQAAATAVTDRNGEATLGNLAPGSYVLRAEVPNGYGFGKYSAADNLNASMMQESDAQTQDSAAFTLTSGSTVQCGVGLMPLAVVSGYVWLDENADGQRQDDEPGQAGCLIELVQRGGDVMYSLVTGEDGNYVFGGVKPGEYNIRATTPDGLMFTKYTKYGGDKRSILTTDGARSASKLVKLKSTTVMAEQNIGLVTEAKLQVQCFLDANYNGVMDEGEQPLSGVEAELIKQGTGKTVVTKTSDANGVILFDCLRANTYKVKALLPEGAAFTLVSSDPQGNQFQAREGRRENTVDNIVITTGETQTLTVGAVLPSTISGVCYLDDDFSAQKNGKEKAVSGLTVTLLDASGNKVASDKTNAKGEYVFENVNPGTYTISLNAKSGYAFTKLGEGNVIVNQGEGAGRSEPFQVTLGSAITGMDIGMILPGTVQGVVFADSNDNGVQDADEKGLAGVTVRLMGEDGEWFAATIGEDGAFCFDAVMPGRYYLRYELPENGVFAQQVRGGNTIAGENGTGAGEWFDFKVGDTVDAPLCGALLLGQVEGMTFMDPNANGVMDAGESTLSGVTLTLTPSRSDLEQVSVTTGSDGAFSLQDLHPDTYTLTLSYPDGLVLSRMEGVSLPVASGLSSQSVQLEVAMGDAWNQQLLGGVIPATLTGQMWLDENNNGTMDADEKTPAGEVVEVIDQQTGDVFAVVSTDEQGAFSVSGVIPGMYTLRYALGENTISAAAGDTTFTAEDDALVMRDVRMVSGETNADAVLGILRYTSLGGQVWVDQGDDVQPLAGAQVSLTNAATGETLQSIISGEDGQYTFGELLPGGYRICVELPAGQVVVQPDDERITSGAQISIMTQCNGREGTSDVIDVRMGLDQLELNIGAVLPGKLGDMAWLDENGNGLQDTDEGGIPGVTVELMRDGEVVATAVTDQYGYYLFTEVYPATYTLRVTAPDEVKPTRQRTDFAGIVSVLPEEDASTVESIPVSVSSDRSNYNADLGYVLRKKGAYPAGYGAGATQDWTQNNAE